MTCIAFVGIGTRPSANPSRPAASQSRKQPCASEIAKKAYWSSVSVKARPSGRSVGRSRWDKRGSGGTSNEVGETIQ